MINKNVIPNTIDATLEATILNPAKIKQAPMKADPRYPAGRIKPSKSMKIGQYSEKLVKRLIKTHAFHQKT